MLKTRKTDKAETWVVYLMTIRGSDEGMNAICNQSEWEAMELASPGHHKLIKSGIVNECEAEKLARGTRGDAKARRSAIMPSQAAS